LTVPNNPEKNEGGLQKILIETCFCIPRNQKPPFQKRVAKITYKHPVYIQTADEIADGAGSFFDLNAS